MGAPLRVGLVLVVAFFCSQQAHAAAAKVWPRSSKRLDGGRVEWTYDLRPLKTGKVAVDLGPSADDAAVKAFLASLPNETKVVVSPAHAQVALTAVGALEDAPLAPSFSRVDTGPFAERDAAPVLPSVDLLLWRTRTLMDGTVAALTLGAHDGAAGLPLDRRALFEQVMTRAVQRYQTGTGTVRDGGKRLAARLGGAFLAAEGKVPDALRRDEALREAAQQEAQELTRPRPRFPPQPWPQWSPRLVQMQLFDRALAESFGTDREGTAAALTLLAILEGDARLQKAWDAQVAYRDALFGRPRVDGYERFRAALGEGGAQAALEDMSSFLSRLPAAPDEGAVWPSPLARPETPVGRFIAQLQGAEQLHAIDELTLAIQDGRVSLAPAPDSGWAAGRDSFHALLLRPEVNGGGKLSASGDYRDRLARAFQAAHGLDGEMRGAEPTALDAPEEGTPGPKVRLMVPPSLELEPLPETYEEIAAAWRRLAEAVKGRGKAGALRPLLPDGRPGPLTVTALAAQEATLFHGLSLVAAEALGAERAPSDSDRAAMKRARQFMSAWRADPLMRADVRYFLPVGEAVEPGRFVHSGVVGVGRREVEASFEEAPEVSVAGDLFEADTRGVARYQVPVLVTASVTVGRVAPLDPQEFRSACEKAGRRKETVQAALPDAMVKTLMPAAD